MSEVSAVQIPLYNRSDPALWFIMCESTFALATPRPITESVTKYNYIVANLSPDTTSLVCDILMHPDSIDPFAQIKRTHKSFRRIVSAERTETSCGGGTTVVAKSPEHTSSPHFLMTTSSGFRW
ncbi:transposon Ty3-G Gag-Pol polyprotein [Trichonephila clavipes]|nr:transposon Ty3-G Gag-Pol polyprotein [Trichonephila clavipes]